MLFELFRLIMAWSALMRCTVKLQFIFFTGLLAFNFVQIDECNGGYIFVFGVARRGILIGAPLP